MTWFLATGMEKSDSWEGSDMVTYVGKSCAELPEAGEKLGSRLSSTLYAQLSFDSHDTSKHQ